MSYQPVTFENFGGLDLRPDPEQSACLDLLNVSLEPGYLRTRDGYTDFLLVPMASSSIVRIGRHTDGKPLFVDENSDMNTVNISTGGRSTMAATLQASDCGYARFGGAGGARSYYGAGNTATTFTRIDETPSITMVTNPGTTSATGGGTVELAVSPSDNRLVWCFQHRVWFSDPGLPETFGANNYVDVDPGDGEFIQAALSWRDLVFVFKQSKFFVFYGTSTDSTGNPVFNYRKVVTRGCQTFNGACVSPNAVYFVASDGVYSTTGGEPQNISEPLDPLWGLGPLPATTQLPVVSRNGSSSCCWARGRLHVGVSLSGASSEPTHMLVWDPSLGWSAWNVPAYSPIVLEDDATLVFGKAAASLNGLQMGRISGFSTATDGAGSAIVSRYRSGFLDLGAPGVEKTVRETELTGQGTPSFAWSRDFGALDTAATVTLGTSPATARGRHRVAKRGSVLSWQASAASGAWRLNRVTAFLRDQRGPAERTS